MHSRSCSNCLKKAVIGIERALDNVCNVESEGDVLPFSIFDNMPVDKPVIFDRSDTVISICFR